MREKQTNVGTYVNENMYFETKNNWVNEKEVSDIQFAMQIYVNFPASAETACIKTKQQMYINAFNMYN